MGVVVVDGTGTIGIAEITGAVTTTGMTTVAAGGMTNEPHHRPLNSCPTLPNYIQ